ncbi:MAG: hypothetical protein C4327_14550 [Meiothermus sp.]
MWKIAALALTLCTFALAQRSPVQRPDAPPLAVPGPYAVGVRTLQLTDPARARGLTVEVWYPAQRAATAAPPAVYQGVVGSVAFNLPGQARRDAAPEAGKFPLLVYSHGQPGSRYQSAYLMEHLASRGFVVAAIDHTGSLYRDLTQSAYVTSLVDRPLDILFVLGQVPKSLPSADGDTAGLIGYSYGGYSVLNAAGAGIERAGLEQYCQKAGNEGPCFLLPFLAQVARAVRPDPRVKAVFVIAPYGAPWYYGSLPGLTVPLFVAVGEEDDVATYARDGLEVYRRAGSKAKYLLTLEGARHNPFVVCPPEARATPEDFERCWEPVWDKERLFDLARHFAAAFFARHLKADAPAGQYLEPSLPGFWPRAKVGIRLEHGR